MVSWGAAATITNMLIFEGEQLIAKTWLVRIVFKSSSFQGFELLQYSVE